MGLVDYITDFLGMNFNKALHNIEREVLYKIESGAHRIVKKAVRTLMSAVIVLFAIMFLALSAVFLFIEYFGLTKTISFLIVGVIILFVALIIKITR